MSSDELTVAAALFAAAFVYVVVGFGFALLAVPVMTLAIPIERAVVVLAIVSVFTTGTQAWTLRHHVQRPLTKRLVIGAWAGMPLGVVVLDTFDERVLRIALGVGVLVATVVLARDVTLEHARPAFDVAAGFVSGVASTSIGTNGPPLVFDLHGRRLSPDAFRATIAAVFTLGNVFTLVLFLATGKVTGDGLVAAVAALPALVAGTAMGRLVQPRVPVRHFRVLVLGLLFVTGALVIVRAV